VRKKRRVVTRTPAARVILDSFTERDIEHWADRSADGQAFFDRVYFDLERQRAANHDQLCDSLRTADLVSVDIDAWVRVTDYRWCLAPLSSVGSLKDIGGRFNIGREIDRARNQEFPALYIAADIDTAYCEFFGGPPKRKAGQLQLQEFALRCESSFTTFTLGGRVENVLDLRDEKCLRSFVRVLSKFRLSADTRKLARTVSLRPPHLIRSTSMLLKRILAPPQVWRAEPQLFGIPAANQIFGRFIRDAGFEGVLYPSQQGGTLCLAVYPENVHHGESRIVVVGPAPPEARCLVLDKRHPCMH
jgi:hypothetical protein